MKRVSFLSLIFVLAAFISLETKSAENSKIYQCEWTSIGNKWSEVVTYTEELNKTYLRDRTLLSVKESITGDDLTMRFSLDAHGGATLRSETSLSASSAYLSNESNISDKFLDFPYRFQTLEPMILQAAFKWHCVKKIQVIPGTVEEFNPTQEGSALPVIQDQKGYRTKLTINVEF